METTTTAGTKRFNGVWICYDYDGQVLSKATYKDGKKHGPWVSYHCNGKLEYKGTYKDGKELL
jgi:antitoxin component YwqK of YwqJK toxin-antitoxin module